MGQFEKLFEPGRIGTVTLKNRLIMAPMGVMYADAEGRLTDRYYYFLEERARGGVGMITTEAVRMIKPQILPPYTLTIHDDSYIPSYSKLTDIFKKHGTKSFLELAHVGTIPTEHDPKFIPSGPTAIRYHVTGAVLREMDKEEIPYVVQKFVDAALRAKKAGFDGVNIDGAHGTLLSLFLSPRTNKRLDEYGGSLQNRARFSCEVIRMVKEEVGNDFPIIFRMSGDDFVEGGVRIDDALKQAPLFVEAGADALDVSGGIFRLSHHLMAPTLYKEDGCRVHLAAAIKRVVNVPVITTGKLHNPFLAEKILEEGKADFIGLGRSLLADPYLPNKVKEGRLKEIRPCIYCNLGCGTYRPISYGWKRATCTVNPVCGKELDYKLTKTKSPRKVMVVGGGLAGMEAATILAQRGHQVTLYEKSEKLGGQWNILAAYRPEISELTHYLSNELMKSGAEVIFNAEVDLGLVKKSLPEVVVIATGAKQRYPEITGIDCKNVVLATDVLSGKASVGKEVVVVGGRLVGLDVANYLAEKGRKVSVVTRREVARDVGYSLKQSLLDEAIRYGVYMYPHVSVESITERGVSVVLEGELVFLKAETVVIATGSASENALYEALKGLVPELHLIGDSKEPRNSLTAIHEGFEVGHLVPAASDSRLEVIHRGE